MTPCNARAGGCFIVWLLSAARTATSMYGRVNIVIGARAEFLLEVLRR